MIFDDKMYYKMKPFELIVCFSTLFSGFVFLWFEDGLRWRLILGIGLFFLGNGIAIAWLMNSLYLKKGNEK